MLVFFTVALCTAMGHNVPSQLPDPESAPEAWNAIEGSATNIDRLIDAGLLRDVTFQIANTDSSLRYLIAHTDSAKDPARVKLIGQKLLNDGSDLITAIRAKDSTAAKIKPMWTDYRVQLAGLESNYDAELLKSAVYICPMHPMDRHLKADEKCSICGMGLIRRHLPSSSVYEKPGEPTIHMTVDSPPLVAGKPAHVKIRLLRLDQSPVLLDDLLEMHTKKIHLLINDLSLGDYHHEHPAPTRIPGEYEFDFTPANPGAYRLWADVVPAASSIQEYVIADIPAVAKSSAMTEAGPRTSSTVNSRKYLLTLNDDKPVYARQTVIGTVTVTDADGKPCVSLEPVMGAFAHIVAFNEDLKTVLHIHPYGKEPASTRDRAGPAFAFKFYAPTPGFYRLYAQVQIDGVNQFAPFDVNVLSSNDTSREAPMHKP